MFKLSDFSLKSLSIVVSIFIPVLLSAQQNSTPMNTLENTEIELFGKVGNMIVPAIGYGLFGTVPHDLKKLPETGQYYTEFALWIGGKDAYGNVFVVSGDGNDLSTQPEWRPVPRGIVIDEKMAAPVRFHVETNYTDDASFERHTPVGLHVTQDLTAYDGEAYALLRFKVTNNNRTGRLSDIYIGVKALVRSPGSDNNPLQSKSLFGISSAGGRPYVMDSREDKESGSLISLVPVSGSPVHLAWWNEQSEPLSDGERYKALAGMPDKSVTNSPGVHTMLVSAGPFDLSAGSSEEFTVIISNGIGESDLDNAVFEASARMADVGGSPFAAKFAAAAGFQRVPKEYRLMQNYPNPFNPETTITYQLMEDADVRVSVFNISGQEIAVLATGRNRAGVHTALWNGKNTSGRTVTSGVYFYRILALRDGKVVFRETRRMVLIK